MFCYSCGLELVDDAVFVKYLTWKSHKDLKHLQNPVGIL